MKSLLLLVMAFGVFAGCATTSSDLRKFDISEGERFPPITLVLGGENRALHVSDAAMLDYIEKSIDDSKVFSAVESKFFRWPVVLKVKYRWEQPTTASSLASIAVSSLTAMIIPMTTSEIHHLEFELVFQGATLYEKAYSRNADVSSSLFSSALDARKEVLKPMLEQFLTDLIRDRPVPPKKPSSSTTIDGSASKV